MAKALATREGVPYIRGLILTKNPPAYIGQSRQWLSANILQIRVDSPPCALTWNANIVQFRIEIVPFAFESLPCFRRTNNLLVTIASKCCMPQ